MAEWQSFSLAGMIPNELEDAVDALDDPVNALADAMDALSSFVSVLQALSTGFVDPLSAALQAITNQLHNAIDDFRNGAFFVLPLPPAFTPMAPLSTIGVKFKTPLLNSTVSQFPLVPKGRTFFKARSIDGFINDIEESLYDMSDSSRPIFSNNARIFAVVFMAAETNLTNFITPLKILSSFFRGSQFKGLFAEFLSGFKFGSMVPLGEVFESFTPTGQPQSLRITGGSNFPANGADIIIGDPSTDNTTLATYESKSAVPGEIDIVDLNGVIIALSIGEIPEGEAVGLLQAVPQDPRGVTTTGDVNPSFLGLQSFPVDIDISDISNFKSPDPGSPLSAIEIGGTKYSYEYVVPNSPSGPSGTLKNVRTVTATIPKDSLVVPATKDLRLPDWTRTRGLEDAMPRFKPLLDGLDRAIGLLEVPKSIADGLSDFMGVLTKRANLLRDNLNKVKQALIALQDFLADPDVHMVIIDTTEGLRGFTKELRSATNRPIIGSPGFTAGIVWLAGGTGDVPGIIALEALFT